MTQTNAELIRSAAQSLTARGVTPFSRIDVYKEIWKADPDRQRGSLDPNFQGLITNAPGGPASALGTPLRRVERGLYVLRPTVPSMASVKLTSTRTQP